MLDCQDLGPVDITTPVQDMRKFGLIQVAGWIYTATWLHTFVERLPLGSGSRMSLIRVLTPGQEIPAHADGYLLKGVPQRRFLLPLITHPNAVMSWFTEDGVKESYHLLEGHLFEINYRKKHEVENHSPIDRVHIQIDVLEDTSTHVTTD